MIKFIADIEVENNNALFSTTKLSESDMSLIPFATDIKITGTMLKAPQGISQKIDVLKNSCTVSSLTIELQNRDMKTTQWMYSIMKISSLKKKKVRIGIIEDGAFTLLYTGKIREAGHDAFGNTVSIEIADVLQDLKGDLFSDVLTANFTGTSGAIVYENDSFVFTNENDTKKITYTGTVFDFIRAIFAIKKQSEFLDENALTELELDTSFIIPSVKFVFTETISKIIDYLQSEIYPMLACYPTVTAEGKVKLIRYKNPTIDDEIIELTADNSSVSVYKPTTEYTVNHILTQSNYDNENSKFLRADYYVESSSCIKFGECVPESPKEFKLQGIIEDSVDTQEYTEKLAGKVFARFSKELTYAKLRCSYSLKGKVIPGKYATLSHNMLINEKGERGVTGIDNIGIYAVIGIDYWGDWTEIAEKNIHVEEEIVIETFADFIKANNKVNTFLTAHGR